MQRVLPAWMCRKHSVTWRVITHHLCAEVGWDGATVGPEGINVRCPHVYLVSMRVPSDAAEQGSTLLGELSTNQTGRPDVSVFCF